MADETLERVYTIPLRRTALRVPRRRRAMRSVKTVREFIARHMKTNLDQVWLDNPVNEAIWARGIEKPPGKLRVKAIRFEDGVVEVSLADE